MAAASCSRCASSTDRPRRLSSLPPRQEAFLSSAMRNGGIRAVERAPTPEPESRQRFPQRCHGNAHLAILSAKVMSLAIPGLPWQRKLAQLPIDSQFLGKSGSFDANPATLSPVIAGLFPDGVVAAELRAPGVAALLLPAEAEGVANAIPTRVQEFAAGRLCARRALAEFGVTGFPVRVARDRQPLWPEFLVGSITHTAGFCAAVVAERTSVMRRRASIPRWPAPSKADLWASICAEAELTWLGALPRAQRAAAVTLIFSAKEAFYKCQYPLIGEWLSFHDLAVTPRGWGEAQEAFDIVPTRPIKLFDGARPMARATVKGSYRFHEGFVSAGVCVLPNTPCRRERSARS